MATRSSFGAALREGGHEHAVAFLGHLADLGHQVVDLSLERAYLDLGVEEAGGADHLLGDGLRDLVLVVAGRGAREDDLVHLLLELREAERAVVLGAGEAEAVVYQLLLARLVAVVHRAQLRNGHVRLVDDREEVVGEVVEQAFGRLARGAAGEGA